MQMLPIEAKQKRKIGKNLDISAGNPDALINRCEAIATKKERIYCRECAFYDGHIGAIKFM